VLEVRGVLLEGREDEERIEGSGLGGSRLLRRKVLGLEG